MKKTIFKKAIIAGAVCFSIFLFECKKEKSNNYGNSGSGGNPPTNQVYMQNSRFNPASITISKGTTITWTNKDNITHTVTSNTNLFGSGDMSNGETFSYTFTSEGTYSYYCKYHKSMGMTGTVIVQY